MDRELFKRVSCKIRPVCGLSTVGEPLPTVEATTEPKKAKANRTYYLDRCYNVTKTRPDPEIFWKTLRAPTLADAVELANGLRGEA
jgi:hypothetical protein